MWYGSHADTVGPYSAVNPKQSLKNLRLQPQVNYSRLRLWISTTKIWSVIFVFSLFNSDIFLKMIIQDVDHWACSIRKLLVRTIETASNCEEKGKLFNCYFFKSEYLSFIQQQNDWSLSCKLTNQISLLWSRGLFLFRLVLKVEPYKIISCCLFDLFQ